MIWCDSKADSKVWMIEVIVFVMNCINPGAYASGFFFNVEDVIMGFDEKYMKMAIELAKKGAGAVNPNPLVGAVIVKDDRVLASGYHARYGDLHAERAAFANLKEDATGAEMYVTLEPCCHFGKQPPCTHAIVEHNISRVYVGSDDPNEMVAGKGIEYLREHGIEVVTQVMKDECDALNQVFFHYITRKTPYVVMKYAMTMDGKISCYTGDSKWVSNEKSRARVQESRNLYSGIMVGINTVLADNPMLTCRLEGGRNPVRIICDSSLRIPLDSNIVNTADKVRTIVACCLEECEAIDDKKQALLNKNVEIISVGKKDNHIDLNELMIKLGELKIDGILLEGGGTLNYSAIRAGIVNEVQIYMAPKIIGGKEALSPVEGIGVEKMEFAEHFLLKSIERIEDDILMIYSKK